MALGWGVVPFFSKSVFGHYSLRFVFGFGAAGWPFFLTVGVGLPLGDGGGRIRRGVRSGPPFSGRVFSLSKASVSAPLPRSTASVARVIIL